MTKKKNAPHDYLNRVSEFITFLSSNEASLNEILRHIVLVVLSPLNAEAIVMFQINGGNQVERVGAWGIPLEMFRPNGKLFNLRDKYPSTDTMKFRRTTWINTLPEWGDDYPLFKEFPYTTGAKSFICFPIEKASTPVAALGVFSRDDILPNTEIEAFLMAVGSVFSMHMFRQDVGNSKVKMVAAKFTSSRVQSPDLDLTERQQVILRLISEKFTNLAISELLGYSESTIRQETISIFAKLNCTGRKEASKIYREKYANT